MKKIIFIVFLIAFLSGALLVSKNSNIGNVLGISTFESDKGYNLFDVAQWAILNNWERPDGPVKVAFQVGHWRVSEAPDELEEIRKNTGTSWGEFDEVDVNLEITLLTAAILEENGIVTELLPVTIPPGYFSDAFVAIHADGSENENLSGFKSATPWRDFSGSADKLRDLVEFQYQKSTLLPKDPNITENMYGYYAFRWWGVDHAVHPMTTSIIFETGFLTNASDRNIIALQPEIAAQGLANGIMEYLKTENLIE